nr:MAG TPA: hypothetical protein [Caudoviricetes sp.]
MKSKTICYDDIFEFCEDVDSSFLRKYYAAMKDNSTVDIAIVAKYDTSRKIINILTDYGFEIANIDFHDAICDGYEDEFVISLCYGLNHSSAMEIWCEPAKRENGYIIFDGDEIYIFDECNSKIMNKVESNDVYIVELHDEIEKEYDEFTNDLELGNCNGDCESCHEYNVNDNTDDEYVNLKLTKDEAETLHKLYHVFGLLDLVI